MTTPRADVSLKIEGALGEASMTESVYAPILDFLADHKTKTLRQIEQAGNDKGVTFTQLGQAMMLLTGAGHLGLVQDVNAITKAKKQTDKINAHLCHKARGSNDVNHLASPVTGGGIPVNRFQQLFLLSMQHGKKQPADWVKDTWAILSAQDQRLLKDGQTLELAEDNIAELTVQAQTFAEKQLPILKALQIA